MARISIEGSPDELWDDAEYLQAQVADFFSDLRPMAKGQGQTIKPHSCPAMNSMVKTWIDGYEAAMAHMNDDIDKFLERVTTGEATEEAPSGPA